MSHNPLPRMTEIEDAIEAREGVESALHYTLLAQCLIMLGILDSRAQREVLEHADAVEIIREITNRLMLFIKTNPQFDRKTFASLLGAAQTDFGEHCRSKGN